MINLKLTPNSQDWGKIDFDCYYPDNDHENFLNVSCDNLIANINRPNGINIIFSLHSIPLKPFIFYCSCILHAIRYGQIPLTNYFSELYFDDLIRVINIKLTEHPTSEFNVLIDDIQSIITKINNGDIQTTYPQYEIEDITNESKQLILKIKQA